MNGEIRTCEACGERWIVSEVWPTCPCRMVPPHSGEVSPGSSWVWDAGAHRWAWRYGRPTDGNMGEGLASQPKVTVVPAAKRVTITCNGGLRAEGVAVRARNASDEPAPDAGTIKLNGKQWDVPAGGVVIGDPPDSAASPAGTEQPIGTLDKLLDHMSARCTVCVELIEPGSYVVMRPGHGPWERWNVPVCLDCATGGRVTFDSLSTVAESERKVRELERALLAERRGERFTRQIVVDRDDDE